jgi:transcription initiation factor TFIIIB Brf1 subunit/transcription initiation factor TFIIB
MRKTKDELEDEDRYEVCNHCGSINLKELDDENISCMDCGAVNFTKTITEYEYLEEQEMKNRLKS